MDDVVIAHVSDNFAGPHYEVQWGIKWGDGEVSHEGPTREHARQVRRMIRQDIKDGLYDGVPPENLEPIKIVSRNVYVSVREWKEVP